MQSHAYRKVSVAEIYRNLYPWTSLNQFVTAIKDAIAYRSEDNSIIALNKPWGVGIFTAQDKNSTKRNQDKILCKLVGHPRYCIQDALGPLAEEFKSPKPYEVLKGIDRYMSGLVLISNNPAEDRQRLLNSLRNSRSVCQPPFGFRAITSGYPIINGNKIYEKVGMELIEVDEMGHYKEPIIVKKITNRILKKTTPDATTFQAELIVKKINRELSTSLVELYVSKLRWDFPRCYISSKTSFILGDVRFSKRIREILGKPIQVSAFKSSHRYDDSYEPLNTKLRERLGVYKNASIPLMLDLHALRLKGFDRKHKKESKDLFIQSPYMPIHFALTLESLDLLGDEDVI